MTKKEQLFHNKPEKETKQRFRKCKYCGDKAVPYGAIQPFCYKNECIHLHNKKIIEKEKREGRQALNNEKYSYLFGKAKQAVQEYARFRDYGQPCISCGCNYFDRQIHGGHFEEAGNNKAIALNLWNINAQCSICNNHQSGFYKAYEPSLRKKIGDEKVDWLQTQNQPHRFTNEYLRRITKIFKRKTARVKKRLGI